MIALKQIDEYGFLLIGKGKGRLGVELRRVDLSLKHKWTLELKLESLNGYHFNKGYVNLSDGVIHWTVISDHGIQLLQIDAEAGFLISENKLDIHLEQDKDHKVFAFDGRTHIVKDGERRWLSIDKNKEVKRDSISVNIEEEMRFGWIDEEADHTYSYRYKASKDHKIMHLDLRKDGLNNRDNEEMYYELELSFGSFTYNSTVDNRLLYFSSQGEHVYAIGKLDHSFSGGYPTTKLSEGFIGFWIAKFDRDLKLVYFNEIPFQFFEGMISKNEISRAAVIDIKEDLEGSLLLSVHEVRGVLYHNKYLITLDKKGQHQGIVGGQDHFNFFEYNRRGLRECASTSKLRLMNDDWSYFASSSLHEMAVLPSHHSPVIAQIKQKSVNSKLGPGELIYNFYRWQNQFYLLEYSEEAKGTLRIELIPH